MLVSFEHRQLAIATPDNLESLIADMNEIGRPGFSMQFPDGTGSEEVRSLLQPALAAQDFILNGSHPTLMRNSPKEDSPLHMDAVAGMPSHRTIDTMHLHFTDRGGLRAQFFTPTAAFMRRGGNLPEEAHCFFQQGQVDDAMLLPICHEATVQSPGLVAFRLFGKYPLAHYFETMNYPRHSHIWSAAYEPDSPAE